MRIHSIVTAVHLGNHDSKHLPLRSGERRRSVHCLEVERHRSAQHARVRTHDSNNVPDLASPADRFVILGSKRARGCLGLDRLYESHNSRYVIPRVLPALQRPLRCRVRRHDGDRSPRSQCAPIRKERNQIGPAGSGQTRRSIRMRPRLGTSRQ